jgi:hypothetical protein
MQWKGMDWPILVDAENRLGVSVVPVTLLIDEHGIIRHAVSTPSRSQATFESFLATDYDRPARLPEAPRPPDLEALAALAEASNSAADWMEYGDALALWGGETRLQPAVAAFRHALDTEPANGAAEFHMGVTYRRLYDTGAGVPDDFTRAVEHWSRALELDPNNYIWRRRLQQYGPRQEKPYPFYDWVVTAREEIAARGEQPVALAVEPRGAELARPQQGFDVTEPPAEPDPEGRVLRDPGRYVKLAATQVPRSVAAGQVARVHLEFRPQTAAESHWNNEARGLVVWLEPPEAWQLGERHLSLPLPPEPVSGEPRQVEFELRAPETSNGEATLSGYALYYVCEGVNGACLYRRQDLKLPLSVAGGGGGG